MQYKYIFLEFVFSSRMNAESLRGNQPALPLNLRSLFRGLFGATEHIAPLVYIHTANDRALPP